VLVRLIIGAEREARGSSYGRGREPGLPWLAGLAGVSNAADAAATAGARPCLYPC